MNAARDVNVKYTHLDQFLIFLPKADIGLNHTARQPRFSFVIGDHRQTIVYTKSLQDIYLLC